MAVTLFPADATDQPYSHYFLLATCLALVASWWMPWEVALWGLAFFGLAHVILELRYVIGRFDEVLRGAFAWSLIATISVVFLARALSGVLRFSGFIEISAGCATLALGCWFVLPGSWRWLGICLTALVFGHSLSHPSHYFFVLTHAHNLFPLLFLWDWSGKLSAAKRKAFRWIQLSWALVIPMLLWFFNSGLGDTPNWLDPTLSQVILGGVSPPGTLVGQAGNFLIVFAFLQSMHYAVWIGFFPWAAPAATARFEARFPSLAGTRIWWLSASAGFVLLIIYLMDYRSARLGYSLLATYHVYLELPLVVLLLLSGVRRWVKA